MTRSASGISAILARTSASPSAAAAPRRASAFCSLARSFIASRSSSENTLALFAAAFVSAIGGSSRSSILLGSSLMLRSPGAPGFSETARRDTAERHRLVTGEAYRHSPTMLAMPNPPSAPLPERPILVVDDDAKIVRLVRTYLERDGFGVVTAADGPAALDAIERHRPALVVLDLMLPELDGRAVIRAVRRDDEAAATPILVLSARGSTLDRIAGLEDGADDYLPKPFSPAELVLRVKSILRRAGPASSDATRARRSSTATWSWTSTATRSPATACRSP